MEAEMKKELTELKKAIKKAEARRDKLFDNNDLAWEKFQDQINELEKQKTHLMQQQEKQGEGQLPAL